MFVLFLRVLRELRGEKVLSTQLNYALRDTLGDVLIVSFAHNDFTLNILPF